MIAPLLMLTLTQAPLSNAWQTSQVSLSGNYTPTIGKCPSDPWEYVRPASSGLSVQEQDWLPKRQASVLGALCEYLDRVNISGFDTSAYYSALQADSSAIPIIGVALGGNDNRGAICGWGLYEAIDGRVSASAAAGTGGLLQAATYVSGLSGGATNIFGAALSGFPTLDSLFANNQFNQTVSFAPFAGAFGKKAEGFVLGSADIFGISSGFHLATVPTQPNVNPLSWTWSGIQAQPAFANGSTPLPIILAAEVIPQGLAGSSSYITPKVTILLPGAEDLTMYEFSPFEFGSWTGRVQAFTDIEFLGTNMTDGNPADNAACVTGYDNAMYVLGIALADFNYWLAESFSNGTVGMYAKRSTPSSLNKRQNQRGPNPPFIPYPANESTKLQQLIAGETAYDVNELALFLNITGATLDEFLYVGLKNPFYGYTDGVDADASGQSELLLVDAVQSGQQIPLWPLIQPERKADFLIASDANGGELLSGWANGTNFRNTAIAAKRAGIPFPELPSVNTFLNYGYTSQPTFFGCNETDAPLILYVADFPYTVYSNISAFHHLTEAQARIVTGNALPLLSQDGGNLAPSFPQCIACGAVWRSLERMGWEKPEFCKQCMRDHCWQGQVNDTSPSYLEPSLVLQPNLTWAEWNATVYN